MRLRALVSAGLAGAAIGGITASRLARRHQQKNAVGMADSRPSKLPDRLLAVMRSGAVVLDKSGKVVMANPVAAAMGILRGNVLTVNELAELVRQARKTEAHHFLEVDLSAGRLGRGPQAVSAHVFPLDDAGHVALLLDDITESRRLEAVRRDFVANISHELKTPVGALTLLAEAMQDAADDPAAVHRFAERMQHEGNRLGRLVHELIELSRLQGADPLPAPTTVWIDHVVSEAIDRTRLAADKTGITVVATGETGLAVRGDERQLVTALSNMVDNAVSYSPPGTRVTVDIGHTSTEAAHAPDRFLDEDIGIVDIAVSDQGIGIADRDLERVFERFYRADPARSRATGGTGLGLAIVKHIASNHGGQVRVKSIVGKGSTFTMSLPLMTPPTRAGLTRRSSSTVQRGQTASQEWRANRPNKGEKS